MLQQTGVDRVLPKFKIFVAAYPTFQALAHASSRDILSLWSGLGYNRRALNVLHAAKIIVRDHKGALPKSLESLRELPGVGPYTAAALLAFAWNMPAICIETNIRTVFLHHCFPTRQKVRDEEILPLIVATLRGKEPRLFYSALMDYGAHLKKNGVQLNKKNPSYKKQNPFRGSLREARGQVLKELLRGKRSRRILEKKIGRARFPSALTSLMREGIVRRERGSYALT